MEREDGNRALDQGMAAADEVQESTSQASQNEAAEAASAGESNETSDSQKSPPSSARNDSTLFLIAKAGAMGYDDAQADQHCPGEEGETQEVSEPSSESQVDADTSQAYMDASAKSAASVDVSQSQGRRQRIRPGAYSAAPGKGPERVKSFERSVYNPKSVAWT
jgi:hypothetical protein